MTVPAAYAWATNGHMIADVAKLGYLDGTVLDATYGEGTFWNEWQPEHLFKNDKHKGGLNVYRNDYKDLHWADSGVDSVVFDPPYKLSGTPALGEFDDRYGIAQSISLAARMDDIYLGAVECFRVCRKYLLVKCQDQVCAGRVQWQTDAVTFAIQCQDGRKVDSFHYLSNGRPQPSGRRQVHARRNYSTLLVFQKGTT